MLLEGELESFLGLRDDAVHRWYHGDLSRHAAEAMLLSNGRDGSYLLRDSQDRPGDYALSVRYVSSNWALCQELCRIKTVC